MTVPPLPNARVSARERRTIAIAAAVLAAALFVSYGVVPFAARWAAREALLAARVDRLARLRALARDEPRLAAALHAREASLAARPRRVVGARTAPLAASAVQALLQQYAAASHVQVSRVDVASAPDSAGPLPAIPATIAGTGDVYGLTELLASIERGARVLAVTDLAVQAVRGPRGESLLQFSVGVRAPYAEVE
ncbi:General secretion pathway M protein [Gemmatirosa kalamazoonensis]|uniref:General secretion pathway M protein n=1 Tax=Gemmatirosa kalamazoonensis TaxID=861299 RepID=W0RQU8_9BACT|nr:type II secretion system protein GspM [Gemmatirosa kalamazoonensis]AHG91943.1 General secretion pathway M protein [Gemmatirosa kalamazoonensis]